MALATEFRPLALEDLRETAVARKEGGWRFVQLLAVAVDGPADTADPDRRATVDLIYSFMKDDLLENLTISAVAPGTEVPSISDLFMPAFVFENEAHDLFGVDVKDIVIDFAGHFYQVSTHEPMTIISPAQKAAREKAAKAAAAKAAKEAAKKGAGEEAAKPAASEADDMEAKLAGMDPAKAQKVRAAMEAKAKRAAKEAQEAKEGKASHE